MGRRDHIKGFLKGFSKKDSASESASATSGAASEPRLNEPTDRPIGASSAGNRPQDLEPRLNEPTNSANGVSSASIRSQDAHVRDLWGLALQRLSLKDKEAVSQIISDSKLDILQHLHAAAIKKRTDCDDRRWKFELNGRQIILRDVAEKIVVWIDKFKQIGDIIVNFDPVHAALPWAGLRFLLEITVAESQQMGALLTGVQKMTDLIGRCQIYEALYLEREQCEQEQWKQAVTNLTSALVTLYATMLSFLGGAIRAYNQGTIIRTLCAILNPAELVGFLDKCQSLENTLAIEVGNCEHIYSRQIQTSSEEQTQKLKLFLADLQTPILRIDSRVATLCERLDSSEQQRILEWISDIQYNENHVFACQERTSGTGEWLLQHQRYREWRASSASMILWLHGDPGAGKTKLISTVVDNLLATFEQSPNDEAFAYFYCDRNQSDRREPALILSSFVRQLSTSRNSDAIQRSTIQMYNQKRRAASGKLRLEESQAILADLFQIYPQITLVVDALDECDKKTRLRFIDILNQLIAESSKPVKILVSSRQDRDIKNHFKDGPNLEIRAIDNRDDIAIFVKHEVSSESFSQDGISSELEELICKTLVEGSGGMFQWAALQIVTLRELGPERDIRNELGKLPATLKTTYDEIYHKIQHQKGSAPRVADRAFQWVMCSCWPLSPAELVAAVCQDPDTDEIDEIYVSLDFVLGACQNLLVVDQELNVCRFSHLSVQEYFETFHWSSYQINCLVGKVCLLLLINNSIKPEQYTSLMKEESRGISSHDVLGYACLNWPIHVQRLEENEKVENRLRALLKRFLGSMDQSSLSYQNWYEMVSGNDIFPQRFVQYFSWYEDYKELSPCSRASLAMVVFGFHKILLDWWTVGFADINTRNSSGNSLLLLGAVRGSVSITEELLKKGADVNATGGNFCSVLVAASWWIQASIVQLLLEKGADVNAIDDFYGSALHAVSYSSPECDPYCTRISIVQLLLDKGADVNAKGGCYGSALQAASHWSLDSVVQLLLDKGADVNATGGKFGSALQAASHWSLDSVVQLLLDKGADVNATGGKFGSALQAASFMDCESVVQLLLDKGADINAIGGEYGSALQAASYSGHKSVMQLLLDKGADINATGGEYGSALQAASFSGHISVMQLLLNKGADVNAKDGFYGGTLQAASYKGHESVVQLLLDNGADVNATGGDFGSALQAASFFGDISVVLLLLDKGADVNAAEGEHGSALEAASSQGNEAVVQLLQEAMKPQ